jgi:hypothetical protein
MFLVLNPQHLLNDVSVSEPMTSRKTGVDEFENQKYRREA